MNEKYLKNGVPVFWLLVNVSGFKPAAHILVKKQKHTSMIYLDCSLFQEKLRTSFEKIPKSTFSMRTVDM